MKNYIKPELILFDEADVFLLTTSGDANNIGWDESWDGVLGGNVYD